MNVPKLRIHLMHPDPVVTAGIRAILSAVKGLDLSFHDTLDGLPAAVVIAGHAEGIRFCQASAAAFPAASFRVLVIAQTCNEWEAQHAIRCGVSAYLLHDAVPGELAHAIRALGEGRRYLSDRLKRPSNGFTYNELTDRESDVLQLLGQGYCNKLIARELGIGVGTVKTHMSRLMAKLNVKGRTPAVIVATQRGLLRAGPGAPDSERLTR